MNELEDILLKPEKEFRGYYRWLFENDISTYWIGQKRLSISQREERNIRNIVDYGLPFSMFEVNESPVRQVLEYATILNNLDIKLENVIEEMYDCNYLKNIFNLDNELIKEKIAEMALGNIEVFCRCSDNAFILNPDGKVVQFYWFRDSIDKIYQIRKLAKEKQFSYQIKRDIANAINIARLGYKFYPSLEAFEQEAENKAKE